jgi:hypothetical protein
VPSTKSRRSGLLGSQVPTYQFVPKGSREGSGREAVELAAAAGLVLEPHQQLVLEGALRERRDGSWASTSVTVVEPRQNGKGGILEARELAGLFLFGEKLLTHTAHRYDTCQIHFRRVKPLAIAISEQIGDRRLRIKRISETNGDEGIELMSGQLLAFKTRAKLGGRGASGNLIVLDEAMYLQELASLVPTLSAIWNPQLWFTGSAPLARKESDHLRKKCRAGRRAARGGPALRRGCYFEWCATTKAKPQDVETWQAEVESVLADPVALGRALCQANPGLGYRLGEEYVVHTEREEMTDEEYVRERLGLYLDAGEAVTDTVIEPPAWKACSVHSSTCPRGCINPHGAEAVDPVAICFEVSIDRKWSQIGVAAPSNLGGTHVEIVENRQGTGWVIDRVLELQQAHSAGHVVCNPAGPAGSLLPEAERKGLVVGILEGRDKDGAPKVHAVTGRDYQQACGAALDDITEHRWRHLGQAELHKAVANATRRDVGDAFVFDRRGDVDISPLTCVALAAWAAGQPVPEDGPSVYEERGLVTLG